MIKSLGDQSFDQLFESNSSIKLYEYQPYAIGQNSYELV